MRVGQPGVHGGEPGLGAVADQDEDEGELDHRRVQHGRVGKEHRPIERVFALAHERHEVEVAEHGAHEGQRDPDRADQDVLPGGLDGRLGDRERHDDGGGDRRSLDGDPHHADVVGRHGDEHGEGEERREDAEAAHLGRRVVIVGPETGPEERRESGHEGDAGREERRERVHSEEHGRSPGRRPAVQHERHEPERRQERGEPEPGVEHRRDTPARRQYERAGRREERRQQEREEWRAHDIIPGAC